MSFQFNPFTLHNQGKLKTTETEPEPTYPFLYRQFINQLYYCEYLKMDVSAFDPTQFLDATMTDALIARPPLPAGRSFIAEIGEVKSEKWSSNKDPSNPKSGIKLNIPLGFLVSELPPDIAAQYAGKDGAPGMDKITLTHGVMLDLVEVNGQPVIDMAPGKNGTLRRYREATGNNVQGQSFNPRMLQGHRVLVKIKHRAYESNVYDEPDAVSKI
jgi:hypothetical protein